ncbi:MAG: hypothetical protein ACD_39C01215G0001 [uncultured bacterium]|nr:MAG: hypothetical protein ACD_39C01215G0001 [uncultured bacterium]
MNSSSSDKKPAPAAGKLETAKISTGSQAKKPAEGSQMPAENLQKPGGAAKKPASPGKAGDLEKLDGLSPDEIADRILGIVDEHQDDEDFDLEASKFWYQAAYKDQLEELFQEKNRLRILVNQLKKRKYTEAEIYELFSRVRKAQLSSEKAQIEAEVKSEQIKKKLINIGIILVTVFIIGQMFFKSNQYALEREQQRIAEVKTLLCEIDKPPLQLKTDFDAQWNEVVGFKTGLQEGMFVKTTTGAHKIKISEQASIVFDADAIFKVEKVTLDSALKKVAEVSIAITQGVISWNIAEDSGIKLHFTFSNTVLAVSYGMGKIDLARNPYRVAVKEGETSIQTGRALARALNGLMEAILSDPPEFKIYDTY